jgi:hypothetical protein
MRTRTLVVLLLLGFVQTSVVSLRAEDDPLIGMLTNAHDLLMKARDDGDSASRINDLKAAKDAVEHAGPGKGSKSRRKAVQLIKAAIYQEGQGDPQHAVIGYINEANRRIGF